MIVALICLASIVMFTAGAITGQAIARRRSREGLHMALFLNALDLAADLTITPDVLEQHRQHLSLSPGALDLHRRANQITATADRLRKRKDI